MSAYDEWLESPYYRSTLYRDAVQSIVDKTGCTWKEAEEIYADRKADEDDYKFERERDRELERGGI